VATEDVELTACDMLVLSELPTWLGARAPAAKSRVLNLDNHVGRVLDLWNRTVLNPYIELAMEDHGLHCV